MVIRDPSSSKGASVNSIGQLSVLSEDVPSEGFQSRLGNTFIVHAECQTALAASGGLLQLTNNDASADIEITRIYIDGHTITPTDLIVTQVFDATGAAGTDVSLTAIVQKNRGSAEVLNASVVVSDASSDLTYTGGTQYHAFHVGNNESLQRNMNSTNIIPAGKSILWGWKTVSGSNAVDGEVISLSINLIKRDK